MTPPTVSKQVVLASNNAKKLAELRRILEGHRIEVLGLSDVADYPEPPETEWTFEGNALLKARAAAKATGLPSLADDSGLCVDALNQMPGVRSARWAGGHGDDKANLELVLAQISDVEEGRRGARFVSAIALVMPDGSEHTTEGVMEGSLTFEPRGDNGFGYDPIFVPTGYDQTTAELAPDAKDTISHRGKALRAMAPTLLELLTEEEQ